MASNFHAFHMPQHCFSLIAAALLLGTGLAGPLAHAEKADRALPMVVESDGKQAASVDLARKVTLISGNVVISQGSLTIRADRVEIREEAPGRYTAVAQGSPGQPAQFRQKRDRLNEYIEGQAERVDYDGGAERVRFAGGARLRVLRDGQVSDEASAAAITYDQRADTIVFDGGDKPSNGASSSGRARLVFVPRDEGAASAPARSASGAGR